MNLSLSFSLSISSYLDYDNAKAMGAVCEVAVEACQGWFPQNDSK